MPRQEFVDPALLAAVDDGGESGGQIGKRIDGVELSGFDERAIVALFSAPTSCPAKKSVLAGSTSAPVARENSALFV